MSSKTRPFIVSRQGRGEFTTTAKNYNSVQYKTKEFLQCELTDRLIEAEIDGWQVHTVSRRHSAEVGDVFWVLLRKEESDPGCGNSVA